MKYFTAEYRNVAALTEDLQSRLKIYHIELSFGFPHHFQECQRKDSVIIAVELHLK
jgi:hypothetical protein